MTGRVRWLPPLSTERTPAVVSRLCRIALLVGAAIAVLVLEPWHGPTIVTPGGSHGLDIGDLPAVPLLALALATGLPCPPDGGGRALALSFGALLLLAGVIERDATGGPLVPVGGGTLGGSNRTARGHRAEPVGAWSDVAVTYDAHRLRLYLNGQEEASRRTGGTLARTRNPLWMGGSRPFGEFFRGLIDEVRIYNRPLSAGEIRRERALSVARSHREAGLVGAYSFDTRSKTRAIDSSGAGNSGVIEGPMWTPHGKFGGALRFGGGDQLVRVPASASLNFRDGLTLSAWIRPTVDQRGWRTIVHRQADVYFLMAGSAREYGAGALDDLPFVLIGAALLLGVVLATDRGRWLVERRSRFWPAIALYLVGSAADAVFAPTGTLIGPLLVAAWLALSASSRRDGAVLAVIAGGLAVLTVVSLGGSAALSRNDGATARALSLALLLAVTAHQAASARATRSVAPSG